MQEILNSVKDFMSKVVFTVSSFDVKVWYLFAVGLFLLILAIVIIACCKGKKKSKKAEEVSAPVVEEQPEVVAEPVAEPVVEDVVAVEQEPKATKKAPAKKTTKKAPAKKEEPVATPVAEPVAEPVVEEEKPVKKAPAKKTATKKAPVKKEEKVEEVVAIEVATEEPAVEETATEEVKPVKKAGKGKWKIVRKKSNEFIAILCASNGEVMLSSEIYSTAEGAKNGIGTIINGVENGNFIIYKDKSGEYYYKLKSATNKLLCAGEIYKTKARCVSSVESVKRIAKDAPIVDEVVEGQEYIDYTPATVNATTKSAKGKWKIEKDENGYSARLYANNGQLMIATEGVSSRATAEKAVENVKKHSAAGNFIIDKDKFGRFYYKLRNAQKSVICIGEAYDTLDGCVKALESVRRFAEISEIVEDVEPKATAKKEAVAEEVEPKATKKAPAKKTAKKADAE